MTLTKERRSAVGPWRSARVAAQVQPVRRNLLSPVAVILSFFPFMVLLVSVVLRVFHWQRM